MHEPRGEVLVVAPTGAGGVAAAVSALRSELPEVRFVPIGRSPRDPTGLGAWRAARGSARSARVVHVHPSLRWRAFPRDLLVAVGARGRVVHLHGYDEGWLSRIERRPAWRSALLGALDGAVVASASHALAARLGALGIAARVVPNAVPLDALPTERSPEPDHVLFLGRLAPGKGADVLVEAARGARFRVSLAGTGPLEAELRRRAPPNVTFEGWVGSERRAELLARASVLALPSAGEASPVAVVEALACGLPVVASPVGDVPLLVGEAGRLVASPDPSTWTRALEEALARPPDTLEARRRTRERVAPAAVAALWRELHAAAADRA